MKRKLQRRRAHQRRRALGLPSRIMAKYAAELAAYRMGLVVWDDTDELYLLDGKDVSEAIIELTCKCGALGPAPITRPRQASGFRYTSFGTPITKNSWWASKMGIST